MIKLKENFLKNLKKHTVNRRTEGERKENGEGGFGLGLGVGGREVKVRMRIKWDLRRS